MRATLSALLALGLVMLGLLVLGLVTGCSSPAPAEPLAPAYTTVPGVPRGIPVEALRYRRAIVSEAQHYWGLSAPTPTLFAQVHQESRFRAEARSKYAAGLAQFTPQTAAGMQQQYPDLRVLCGADRGCELDPGWAIRAMVLYDRALWRERPYAEGDERLAMMLTGYNSGSGWVNRERTVCALRTDCDPSRYFGHIQAQCGKSVPPRAAWACAESVMYADVIIHVHRPLYARWLVG